MLGFTLKKWAGAFLQPLPLISLLMLLALIFHFRGKHKLSKGLQILSISALLLSATPPLSSLWIKNIEADIPQFDLAQKVDFVVVLGCGHHNDARRPITAQPEPCSLYRTVEGIRLLKANPNAKIIFSGYGDNQPFSAAETNSELAISLGVPDWKIIREPRAKDTREEALLLTPTLKDKHFALVTSASHMPRAMVFFEQQGLTPIAAPTGHRHIALDELPARRFLPEHRHLTNTSIAMYEWLGKIWQKLILS